MTTITTMEDLTAVPVGTEVMVERAAWQRTDTGLARGGIDLTLENFTGAITAGVVTSNGDRPAVAVGQWWQQNNNRYTPLSRVLNPDGTTQTRSGGDVWDSLVFNSEGVFISRQDITYYDRVNLMTDVPVALSNLTPFVLDYRHQWDERRAARARLVEIESRPAVPAPVIQNVGLDRDEVRSTIIEHTDSDGDFTIQRNGLLEELGLDPVAEEVEVTVNVYFERGWDPSYEVVGEAIGVSQYDITSVEEVTVRWEEAFTFNLSGHGCVCDEVDTDDIRQAVENQRPGWWEFYSDHDSVDCDND